MRMVPWIRVGALHTPNRIENGSREAFLSRTKRSMEAVELAVQSPLRQPFQLSNELIVLQSLCLLLGVLDRCRWRRC